MREVIIINITVANLRDDQPEVKITCYVADDNHPERRIPKRQAMIVFPGGGYDHLSWREAEPIAMKFYSYGMNAFVVDYSINEKAVFPNPLKDASLAVAYVRSHAEEFNIDPDQIYVIGFSAGGHMAGMIGTMWHHEEAKISPDMPYGLNKPNGMLICYGVVTMGEHANEGTPDILLGHEPPFSSDEIKRVSIHTNVDENTCPAFVWCCSNDWVVPPQNSTMLCRALADNNIPFEFKMYDKGPHGISVGTKFTAVGASVYVNEYVGRWVEDAIRWVLSKANQELEEAK